jgi:methylenetetrahydrofolate--tRNA-(uracil-5-)-methyltransferase
LLAGLNATRRLAGEPPLTLPVTTMLGALCHYITHADSETFQPMKANFGLLPPLPVTIRNKRARYEAYAKRAREDFLSATGEVVAGYRGWRAR